MNAYSNFKFSNPTDDKCIKIFNNEFVTVSQVTHEGGNENMRCILSATRVAWLVFGEKGKSGNLIDFFITEGVGLKRNEIQHVTYISSQMKAEALKLYQLYYSLN